MKLQSRSYYVRRQEDSIAWLQNEELRALPRRVNSASSMQRDAWEERGNEGTGWHVYVLIAEALVPDNPQMSDFREANMWLNACHSTQGTGLVLGGWLQARLPLCISLTPCRCVCGWVCLCAYEGIHSVRWLFEELSTETGFPQTIITNTPETSILLSWYFFFFFCFHLCFSLLQLPKGTLSLNIQPTRLGLFSLACPCRCPLKVSPEAMWGQHILQHQMRRAAWRSDSHQRKRDSALQTWTAACRLTCPEAGLLQVAHFRRSLSILFFFSITIGWRMKLSWTEGLRSLNMCVMKKK